MVEQRVPLLHSFIISYKYSLVLFTRLTVYITGEHSEAYDE